MVGIIDKLSSSQLLDFIRSEGKCDLLPYLLVLRCSMCMLRFLSMPSMAYSSVCITISWNGLSMPTEGCSVCMPIVITNFKVKGVKQDSVSITFIYGTESCLTPLTMKLVMTMGMHTEHPSVGMLSPFQLVGMCIELQGILGMCRHLSMHIEHLRTNKKCSKPPFPSDLMKSSSWLDDSLSTIPTKVLLRESTVY